MADDIGGAVVIAPHPDQAEIVAVGVAANHLQAREMPLREPFEVEVVENVAIDDELWVWTTAQIQEFFEKFRLTHVAAEMEVADHDAIVQRLGGDGCGRIVSGHGGVPVVMAGAGSRTNRRLRGSLPFDFTANHQPA